MLHACVCSAALVTLFATVASPALGAPGPRPSWLYDPWRTNDGLPNNDVTGVVQGPDGALIVATFSGLARFDGLRFRRMDFAVAGDRGHTSVAGICPGRHGCLWLISRGHVVEWMDGEVERAIPLPEVPRDSRFSSMFVTQDDAVWVSFDKGSLFRVPEGGEMTTAKTGPGLAENFSTMAAVDAKGTVWAAGPGVLARWDGSQFVKVAELPRHKIALTAARDGGLWLGADLILLRYTEEKGVVPVAELDAPHDRTRISTLLEDSAGRVWCGTFAGGLHVWSDGYFEKVDIAHHDVWSLTEDKERNLWVGTGGGGMIRVRERVLKLLDEPDGPVNQTPRSLCLDAHGHLWIVGQTGDVHVRGDEGWHQVDIGSELHTASATCVVADDKGSVWIACAENKLARWDGKAFLPEPLPEKADGSVRIYAMTVARDGSVWVGRGGELLHGTAGKWESLAAGPGKGNVMTIVQDRAGVVWAGTANGRLLRVNGATLEDETPEGGGGTIRCLLPTPDGALWIGRGDSLLRLKDGRWNRVTRSNGLEGASFAQLTLDENGRVWMGVDQGVLVATLDDLNKAANGEVSRIQCSNYAGSGFQAGTGYTPNVAVAPGGWLWYCSRSGTIIANMNAAGSNHVPPQVSIEGLSVNGRPEPTGPSLKFGPRLAEITFELGAMSYRLPDKVKVFHQIKGVDAGWVQAGKDRIARYTGLPAGSHTLRVRAINEDGVPSEREATLAFEVVPAFWEAGTFRAVMILLGGFGAFMVARYLFLKNLRRETEALREQVAVHGERVRISRDMHDQLGASLTQISLLTELMSADGVADKRVAQLARTARQATTSLDEIVWAVNPRHDHFASVVEYLGQQAVNLLEPAGIHCRLDIPEDMPDRHLPAEFRHQVFLIVREALNNVIKHASASSVSLSMQTSPQEMRLLISDDGKGGAAKAGGDGLGNMRDRAAALGGDCQIHSTPGAGTTIELQLPWPRPPRSS